MPTVDVAPATVIASPRIRGLAVEIGQRDEALAEFWVECAEHGTPLIEESAGPAGSALVTFVWRAREPVSNVVLLEWIAPGDFPEKQMTHLPGTDLWYRTLHVRDDVRTSYQFSPNDSLVPKMEETDWPTRQARWVSDPYNPASLVEAQIRTTPDLVRFDSSILEMPNAVPQPWIAARPGVPAGVVEHQAFASRLLDNTRDLWVYTPAGYDAQGTPLPVLVLFDGERHDSVMRVPTVLDNLIAAGEIPRCVALLIGNVDRGDELPCNPRFAQALATEVLPWLGDSYRVTADPRQRIVAGQSYGGLAALYAALMHPDAFGNVLSQSGSFWWKPDPMNEHTDLVLGDAPGYAWLPAEVAAMQSAPIRIWMEVGLLENRSSRDGAPSMVATNRHMRDVLVAKGYDLQYREFSGGHDYVCWRDSLADGLIALFGAEENR